jgi:oligopeptide transport system substrate-binding protein
MKKSILILMLSLSLIAGLSLIAFSEPITVNLNLGTEPPTIDPALASDTTSIDVVEQLFLGLTDYNDLTMEVIPELATSWEVSEDGLVWAFHLRKDVKWTDGKPVTAHDIEYAVRRTCDPATASDYAYVLYIIKGAKEVNTGEITDLSHIGVKAVDDYTIQFALNQPAGYFPAIAGMWVARPVPKWTIEKYGDKWTDPENIVTNGSYLLKKWAHDDEMILEKNPDYYEADKVQIERVHFVMVVEASTAMAMYENGELDCPGEVPLEDIDRIKADPVLSKELFIAPRLCTYYYGFNNTKPPMDNPLVRKAFSAAINRQSLIDYILKGEQVPATTFTCPGIFGHVLPEEGVGIGYNPDAARKYLADAGYPGGKGLPEVTLMYNTSEAHAKIAQAIQQMWKEVLGVEVNVVNQEWKVYLKTLSEDAPQIYRLGWCADYADANNWVYENFHSIDSDNNPKWSNAEFDRVVEQAARESDPAKRLELYKRAEQILCEEEAAIAPIYFYTFVRMSKPYLIRTLAPMAGDHIKDWIIKK